MALGDDEKSKLDVDNTQSARFPPLSPNETVRISASESVFSLQCRLVHSHIRPDFRRVFAVNVIVNGQEKQLEPGTTVAELLTKLEVSPRQVAVEVNQELVPRRQHAEHALQAGDRLEIVGFVGGG